MSTNISIEIPVARGQNITQSGVKLSQANRQNYLDWLRVGAMFLLLFYHTARLFNLDPWHIKNAVLSPGIQYFTRFLDIWHMPLFFILAGASVWFALDRRTPGILPGSGSCGFWYPWFSAC